MTLQLDSINLYIKDMVKTAQFYRLLGLDISPEAEQKSILIINISNKIKLAFYHFKEVEDYFKNKLVLEKKGQNFNLSFRVSNPQEVDKIYNKIIENGFRSFQEPSNAPWNQRVAFILDPDDNLVEINAFL